MVKTLELVFRNTSGQSVTVSLADPKSDLTLTQAQVVMQDIISKNIFTSKGGDLAEAVGAYTQPRYGIPGVDRQTEKILYRRVRRGHAEYTEDTG